MRLSFASSAPRTSSPAASASASKYLSLRQGSRQLDPRVSVHHRRASENLARESREELLHEAHHVGVVPEGSVAFEHREFRIMRTIHPLVAEILRELEDALDSADDEPFEVELVRDAKVEVDVERVVMRHEGARERSAVDRLQDGGLDLDESPRRRNRRTASTILDRLRNVP